jgi:Protein of unknown function (DUF4238)
MSNGNEARNHHWVPQCYLKGFAKSRSKKAKLHVIDAIARKAFQTTPRNVAAARDFNRIKVDELPPNMIESGLSSFEGQVDKALEHICAQCEFSNADDRIFVFNLIALLAVRNPRRRESLRQFHEDISKKLMGFTLATKERYESSLAGAKKAGVIDSVDDVTYEEARNFVARGELKVDVPTTRHVALEMQSVDTVLPLLLGRKWVLLIAPTNSGGFVTTDHPVVLQWIDAKDRGAFYPPGFGLCGTEVIFPLSHDLALSGTFEGREAVIEATTEIVAATNGIVIAHGHRQVYARDDKFRYMITHGVLRHGSDVLADLVKYRDQHE